MSVKVITNKLQILSNDMKPYIKIGCFPYPYKRSAKTTAIYGKRTGRKLVRRLKKSLRQSIKTELKKYAN